MNLRHIEAFVAVAEELHFGRAAKRLHIEQSPLSRRISRLEADLGVTLLHRNGRGVRLTVAGRVFLEDALRVMLACEQAQARVRDAAAGYHGTLLIGLAGDIGRTRLAALLALCRQEAPEVSIRLTEVPLAQLLHGLGVGMFDAGLASVGHVEGEIVAAPLWRDPFLVALPARHPLLAYKEVPLQEVVRYSLVLSDPQACDGCHQQREHLFRSIGVQPAVAEYVSTHSLMLVLVAAGYGVGFCSAAHFEGCTQADVVAGSSCSASPRLTTTWPSSRNSNATLSPASTPSAWRTALGRVSCPLDVTVASSLTLGMTALLAITARKIPYDVKGWRRQARLEVALKIPDEANFSAESCPLEALDWILCYFSTMDGNSRHQVIKRLQTTLPRGAPFDLTTLAPLGVSSKLAARYAEGGWLVRLAQGVYAFPNDEFGVYGALKFLQQRVPGLHVGGKSALGLQGVRHNLGRDTLVLWGNSRYELPVWFTSRFPARYVHAHLFDWPDAALADKTLTTPPGLPDRLQVAVSERAVLELLYEAGTKQSLEEARNLFDGLRSPRKELLGQLLSCCTSVKTVRLFLTWARETQVVDVKDLLERHPLRTGSEKRWMSRLADGTLLSLNPHG